MEIGTLISLFLIVILTYWSAWISSTETALFSLPLIKVNAFKTDIDPRKKLVAELLNHPRDLLVTVFMINTFVNILLQNVTSDMFGRHGSWQYKIGIPLILTLIFGEIIPKYIGLQNNLSISYRVAPKINFLQKMLRPLRKWIVAITAPVSRVFFFFLKKEPEITREEIKHILETSEKKGILQHEEAELIEGYLTLQECSVKEQMWPKEDILYYDILEPLSRLNYLFVKQECSRIPIVEKSLENVLGILTAPAYFTHQNLIKSSRDLIPFLKKPYFIPETTGGRNLLRRLDERGEVLALVVDEYGSITGLITKEDLIEVVIGPIEDLRDQQSLYLKAGKNEVISSGKWELAEFNDYFKTNFVSEGGMVTIGGWLIEELGEIPKSGAKIEKNGFLFQILAASPNRITRLFIRKLKKS